MEVEEGREKCETMFQIQVKLGSKRGYLWSARTLMWVSQIWSLR